MIDQTDKEWPCDSEYPAIARDDGRIQYCASCEKDVRTVPGEDVPNQALRCCCICGGYTLPVEPTKDEIRAVSGDFQQIILIWPRG